MRELTPEEAVLQIQPQHAPEASMGGNNTYCVYCDVVGWRPNYGVCLNKISAYEREGMLSSFPACESAIKSNSCLSYKMRSEEQNAGKTIYFIDRDLLQAEMTARYGQPLQSRPMVKSAIKLSATQTTPIAIKKTVAKVELPADNGYAAAINAAIAQTVSQASTTIEKKGMSLLDLARAQMHKTTTIGVSHE